MGRHATLSRAPRAGGRRPLAIAERKRLCSLCLLGGLLLGQPDAWGAITETFSGTNINTLFWDVQSYNEALVSQDGELEMSSSPSASWTGVRASTQFKLAGDLDIQVSFRAGVGWTTPIDPAGPSPHLDAAVLGIHQDDVHNIRLTLLATQAGRRLAVYSFVPGEGLLASVPSETLEGVFRIVRSGTNLMFQYDVGNGWQVLHAGPWSVSPVDVYIEAFSVNTEHPFSTRFDDFVINAGTPSSFPLVWPERFQPRTDYYLGGAVCDYLAKSTFGHQYWLQTNLLDLLQAKGMQWVRVGVTTISHPELRETPPQSWHLLPWRSEFWSSRQYAAEIMRQAASRGMRLNLFFFLSDTAAHAGVQNAPAAWRDLSVEDTGRELEAYTYSTTQFFIDQGLRIELYEIGNEIQCGILNFRPGERIALPPGVDQLNDMDYMTRNVWNIEAALLKRAIAGVRRANPNARIVLHITGLEASGQNILVRSFFETMALNGVEFDFAGLSHPYPWAGWPPGGYSRLTWFQRLHDVIQSIAALGKPVVFCEASYPHDPRGIEGGAMPDYPYSLQGQADWLRDQLLFGSNNPHVKGFFYFYPEWFPGMDADSGTWNLQSSGLFLNDYQTTPALDQFLSYSRGSCFVTPTFDGERLSMTWNAVPGQGYYVECSADLRGWLRCSDSLVAVSNVITWSSNLTQGAQFFRVSNGP